MTTISYLSDLHLELQPYHQKLNEIEPGDICILAGDIISADYLPERRTDADARKARARFRKLLDILSQRFEHILYVMGNHEHYGSFFFQTPIAIKEFLHRYGYNKVRLLDNDSIYLNGILFLGTTMWTDFDCGNPIAMVQCQQGMNDYNWIGLEDTTKISVNFIMDQHRKSRNWMHERLSEFDMNDRPPIVVITHHAPSRQAESVRKTQLSPAFVSDLTEFGKYEITLWIHGHTHHNVDYFLWDNNHIPVRQNQKGYDFERKHFDVNRRVHVQDGRLIETN